MMIDAQDSSVRMTNSRVINLVKQAPICLQVSSPTSHNLKEFLTIEYRELSNISPSSGSLIDLVFELYDSRNDEFSQKISKAIKLINEVIGFSAISFL